MIQDQVWEKQSLLQPKLCGREQHLLINSPKRYILISLFRYEEVTSTGRPILEKEVYRHMQSTITHTDFFGLGWRIGQKKNLIKAQSALENCGPSGVELFSLSLVHNCACSDKLTKQVTSTCRKVHKFQVLNPFRFYFKIPIYLFLTAQLTVPSGFLLHWSAIMNVTF